MKQTLITIHPVLHSATLLEKRIEILLRPTGIRHRQALILDALSQIGPTSQRHLAKQFDVSAGSMSSMTERLVTLGFITQITNPENRRSDILDLTPDGREVLKKVWVVWQEATGLITSALGENQAETLTVLSTKLRNALGGTQPEKERHET
ncbi:MarR family winged helix-turn-helix transcriptional regulator [Roseibium porphyridii]|uniref:MarR family winged helix-turn-helix transcriptional regulator n=1 Tax=Roseibium porphyridii TaxID=2866279 RepID=A0ABY8EYR5_9HYPH|nr:MarR family winged helix-turn-helix transcriptional regulator [Roseibium sp. KMA01]WFE87574.1 MarR family winged helix-turn-helix transcriptional regulator [Roseibium sp. KMA01]